MSIVGLGVVGLGDVAHPLVGLRRAYVERESVVFVPDEPVESVEAEQALSDGRGCVAVGALRVLAHRHGPRRQLFAVVAVQQFVAVAELGRGPVGDDWKLVEVGVGVRIGHHTGWVCECGEKAAVVRWPLRRIDGLPGGR